VKSPINPEIHNPMLQNMPIRDFHLERWYKKLSAGEIINETVSQLPPDEQAIIEHFKIRSLLHVPIVVAQQFWGFISLTDLYVEREWTEAEIGALQTMAASIGAAIQRHQTEEALRKQGTLLQGIALATNLLLKPGDYPTALQNALAVLGEAVGTDRVYIFENHPHSVTGEVAVSQRFEWVAESVTPQIDNPILQDLPWQAHGMMRWYNLLTRGEIVSGPTRHFPEAEHTALAAQDICSLLIVPIFINQHFWGYIGFDDCHSERQWTQDEINALQTMAASVGAAVERYRGEDKLAAQLAAIQELEGIKSKVIRMVSHDLRGPLSRIQIMLDLLEEQLQGALSEHQKQYFTKLQKANNQIEELITNILSLERIEENHRLTEPLVWQDLIAQVVESMSLELANSQHQLMIECEPYLPIMRANKSDLNQALSNLLSNAIKYTPPGGHITIRAFLQNYGGKPQVHVEVADNGIGIPKEKQKSLFQPFYRAQQAGTENISGTGLGLSIVKSAVEYHNGSVYMCSKSGCGSTFGFRLPLSC
jgi:signal transduction histidine kinase